MTFEKLLEEWKPEAVEEYRSIPSAEIADDVSRRPGPMKRRQVIEDGLPDSGSAIWDCGRSLEQSPPSYGDGRPFS